MLLPYASYLRIYEPVEQGSATGAGAGQSDPRVDTVSALALAREHQIVLGWVLSAMTPTSAQDDLAGCYVLHREGRTFVCPVDLALRSWLATSSFAVDVDPVAAPLLLPADAVRAADRACAGWKAASPSAEPHIRQATWGIPRTWFLLVTPAEREHYDLEGQVSVRFRTPVFEARRRLLAAFSVLNAAIDDDDLLAEVSDLGQWLAGFPEDCWLELDYAGVAALLGAELPGDRSAYEIASALEAIERRDFAGAGETYHRFVERWRAVAARERAS